MTTLNKILFLTLLAKAPMAVAQVVPVDTLALMESSLDEIVVTGYGGQQKRALLTTAISKMHENVTQNASFSNVGQALQGTVTGLRVSTNSGQPGIDPVITLRGGATITGQNNGALIVVDGIVRESLNDINAADIESIQVLKDAAATAIYGARANGGVILIETKKGKSGRTTVTLQTKLGASFANKGYEYLNAGDYLYYNRYAQKLYTDATGKNIVDSQNGYGVKNSIFDVQYLSDENKNLMNQGWQVMNDPYYSDRQLIYKDYSGQLDDFVFNNGAFLQEHHLSLDGGNDKGTFNAALGYQNQQGILIGTGYERFTGILNASYRVLPILNIKGGVNYAWSTRPELYNSENALFYRTRSTWPTWNPFDADGNPASGTSKSDGNPAYYRDKWYNNNGTRKTTVNLGFDLDLIPRILVLTGNASIYHYDYNKDTFQKAFTPQIGKTNATREATSTNSNFTQKQFNLALNYKQTFKQDHRVDAMLGGEYFIKSDYYSYASTTGSPTDDIPTLNAGSTITSATTTRQEYRIASGYARVNYDYKMRYLLSVNARMDGISKLQDHRWGFFPGVSAGWNVSEEDFFRNASVSNVITTLKPRVSYGVNGNINGLGNYDVYGVYAATAQKYNGSTGYYNSAMVNTGLRWEQSHTFDVGVDVGLWNGKVNLILDYYNRTTKDLLTTVNLPSYTGFSSVLTNLGELRNQGFELEINANIIRTRDWQWDISANLTTVKNTILKLPTNDKPNNQIDGFEVSDGTATGTKWICGYAEGGQLGDVMAYNQVRVFRDWDDINKNAATYIDEIGALYKKYGPALADEICPSTGKKYKESAGWLPLQPGDSYFEDINGDGKINTLDRKVIGNYLPKVTGGFNTTVRWKGLSLYARFDYALGHTMYNGLKVRVLSQSQGTFNLISDVKDTWSESNPDAVYPIYSYFDYGYRSNYCRDGNNGNILQGGNSVFYEKADYLCLRELTVKYELPKKWLKNVHMQKAEVYVTGTNLGYITAYSGTNPEPNLTTSYTGFDNGRYPIPRTVLVGANLTF